MNRRTFVKRAVGYSLLTTFGLVGCGNDEFSVGHGIFSYSNETVTLYDTHAMALYFDGGLGPKTGIIRVEHILANMPIEMEFWHGHGGVNHRFIVTSQHFEELKQLKRVYLETDTVADHSHKLFIDPTDPRYRVAGAPPIEVPLLA